MSGPLAAPAVWDALVLLVMTTVPPTYNGSALLAGDRIYRDGEVPSNAPLGYILIGGAVEPAGGFYNGRPGRDDSFFSLHCWHTTPTKALYIANWLTGLLHHRTLTLEGHVMWRSTVQSLNHVADPERRAFQVPLNWTISTLEA